MILVRCSLVVYKTFDQTDFILLFFWCGNNDSPPPPQHFRYFYPPPVPPSPTTSQPNHLRGYETPQSSSALPSGKVACHASHKPSRF